MEKRLNENQKKAVAHDDGAMMVLAGPGSGKTTVILARGKRILKRPDFMGKILVMTYTKATATEMQERFSFYKGSRITFSTFHSLFFRVLKREYNYSVEQIISEEDKNIILLKLVEELDEEINDYEELVQKFQSQLSYMNNQLIPIEEFVPYDFEKSMFDYLYKGYKKYKDIHEKIDFDDMLVQCYELFISSERVIEYWRNQYEYIMVDEFQDINRVQYECLKFLSAPKNNIMVVGDDDQSIYGFRGARPDYLLDFEYNFPNCEMVILNENYRFHKGILNVAERVIRENTKRYEKNLATLVDYSDFDAVKIIKSDDNNDEGKRICDKIQECINLGIEPKEIAIIYRTNIQGGVFVREMHKRGIPYIVRDGGNNIYSHWIVKDILAYLSLATSIDDSQAFLRIINKPKRYISKEFLSEAETLPYTLFRACFACPSLKKWQEENLYDLQREIQHIKKLSPYKALKYIRNVIGYDEYLREYAIYRHINFDNLLEIANEVTEMSKDTDTFEKFKEQINILAVEVKNVNSKKFNSNENAVNLITMHGAKGLEFTAVFLPTLIEGILPHKRNENIEEERRLFYVGITRAKQILYLSTIKEHYGEEVKSSPFLKKLRRKTKT